MPHKVCCCIRALLLSALLVCMFIVPGAAASLPDAAKEGSITVNIDVSGTMSLYQVAQYNADTHKYQTTLLFKNSGFDQEHLTADDAAAMLAFIQSLKDTPGALSGTVKEIANGYVRFTGLPLGIYLLVHEGPSGAPEALPFFVTIPMREDGAYVYDVAADGKARIVTPTPAPPTPTPTPSTSPPESPSPTEPEPTEPEPTEPEPTEPEPTEPEPTEPEPTEPDEDFPHPDDPFPDIPDPDTPEPLPSPPELSPEPSDSVSGSALNSSAWKLPNTGQLNWPIPVLVVLGLILFGFGWYLHQSRRGGK